MILARLLLISAIAAATAGCDATATGSDELAVSLAPDLRFDDRQIISVMVTDNCAFLQNASVKPPSEGRAAVLFSQQATLRDGSITLGDGHVIDLNTPYLVEGGWITSAEASTIETADGRSPIPDQARRCANHFFQVREWLENYSNTSASSKSSIGVSTDEVD